MPNRVYELADRRGLTTKYPPIFWCASWMRREAGLNPIWGQDGNVPLMVKRMADMAMGVPGLGYWKPETQQYVNRVSGSIVMLDPEAFTDAGSKPSEYSQGAGFYDMCRMFKSYAPWLPLTMTDNQMGIDSADLQRTLPELVNKILQKRSLIQPYLAWLDYIQCGIYVGRAVKPNTRIDDARDSKINVAMQSNYVDAMREVFKDKKLVTTIWPRMIFAPDNTAVPDEFIVPYVQAAAKADIVTVFDLRRSDGKFIQALDAIA